MSLYLVRHAKAGSRSRWSAPDQWRPLSPAGIRQAEGLVTQLAEVRPRRILSSPSARCVQTVEPLARAAELQVELDDRLAEGAAGVGVLRLVVALGLPDDADVVMCSHGDVIPELIDHLASTGTEIRGEPDWRKGSTWVLELADGHPRSATALGPPEDLPDEE